MGDLTITTTLEPFGPATAIILTDDQVAALGAGKRAPVRVTIDGHSARLRLAVMGGQNCVGISKANRAELGVDIGDTVTALIEVDDTPREVEVPAALAEALAADPVAAQAFEKLAFTHRKGMPCGSPRPSVRRPVSGGSVRRLEMLKAGKTRS